MYRPDISVYASYYSFPLHTYSLVPRLFSVNVQLGYEATAHDLFVPGNIAVKAKLDTETPSL